MRGSVRARALRVLFPPRRATPAASPPRRILIIRPDQIGDLLFATPVLARLRAAYPEAHLTGLVGPWGRAVWERQPALDALETVPFPGIVARPRRPWEPYTLLRATARRLRAGRYDCALILRFDYWWGALLAEQSGIPRRWGFALPAVTPWLTDAVPYQPGRHEVEQDWTLAAAATAGAPGAGPAPPADRAAGCPALRFALTAEDRAAAAALVPPEAIGRLVCIHPGTNASRKLWTPAGWAAVTRHLLAQGSAVAFTGSAGEAPLIAAIQAALDPAARAAAPSLAGRTTLGALGALFAASRAVLGVDSGPLHLAAAVGTPTLRLYGPSDEAVWGPWGPAARNVVVRAPGTRPGRFLDPTRQSLEGGPEMLAITPEQVIAALPRVLEARV